MQTLEAIIDTMMQRLTDVKTACEAQHSEVAKRHFIVNWVFDRPKVRQRRQPIVIYLLTELDKAKKQNNLRAKKHKVKIALGRAIFKFNAAMPPNTKTDGLKF